MKMLVTIIVVCISFYLPAQKQDSVMLKVLKTATIKDTTWYLFKIIETGEKVFSKCVCVDKKKKGDVIRRAVKDLEFIKPEN